jgi:hypothetical protein
MCPSRRRPGSWASTRPRSVRRALQDSGAPASIGKKRRDKVRPIDGDYISDALEAELCREGDDLEDRQWAYGYAAGVSFAVRKLAEAPTLTPPNEWVSVEERLPDAEKEVRLFCVTPNGYKYQCQGFYVPPGMRRDDSDYSWDWECCDQYDEDSDDYFVNPGWYESSHNWDEYSAFGIADKVTYWMPLPEPPGKEG